MVHRCTTAAAGSNVSVELIDLRTIAPWDRACVLQSVRKTGRCLIVHEDTRTAGFGAEVAATIVDEAFWALDAPVERVCVEDVPMPYDPGLLQAVLPSTEMIRERMEKVASV
jgi:2-oxoisovalerate dehydrogenase E1 component